MGFSYFFLHLERLNYLPYKIRCVNIASHNQLHKGFPFVIVLIAEFVQTIKNS